MCLDLNDILNEIKGFEIHEGKSSFLSMKENKNNKNISLVSHVEKNIPRKIMMAYSIMHNDVKATKAQLQKLFCDLFYSHIEIGAHVVDLLSSYNTASMKITR